MNRHVSDETFRHAGETIFQSQRSHPETNPVYQWPRSTTGFSHVCVHPQLNLPRSSQELPVRNAQVRSRLTDIPGAASRTQKGRWRAFWATAGLACVARLMAPFKQRGSANQILTLGR